MAATRPRTAPARWWRRQLHTTRDDAAGAGSRERRVNVSPARPPAEPSPGAEEPASVLERSAPSAPPIAGTSGLRIPLWVSTVCGVIGYSGMVVTGTRLGPLPDPPRGVWWFHVPAGHLGLLRVLFYVATALALCGWAGVGVEARRGRLSIRAAVVVLVAWSIPLLLGPPIFSKDLYSYIGQGLLAHRGLNPYHLSPSALGPGPLINSIASVWRHSPAPYGPFFVEIARAVTAVVGTSIVPGVIVMRAIEIVGMALLAVFVPRLARQLGTDPAMALWLGVLSPLVLLSFMASGHNDCLMMGLVVAGVSLSLGGRRSLALVLCALAAMIKAPAAGALVFLVVDELRLSGGGRRALRILVKDAAVVVGTVAVVTLASGLGWQWLQPSRLRIPAELRIDATPTVSIGVAIARVLSLFHIHVSQSGTITAVQTVGGIMAAAGTLWLLWRVRRDNLVRVLAAVLALVVLAGPTLWPWYLSWGLIFLACTSSQWSKVPALVAAATILLVGPVGTPQLAGYWFWAVSATTVAGCAWLASGRRWTSVILSPNSGPVPP